MCIGNFSSLLIHLDLAMQRRLVKCKVDNVTVSESKCDEDSKPTHRQECTNEKCVGKWKVGAWSEVNFIFLAK